MMDMAWSDTSTRGSWLGPSAFASRGVSPMEFVPTSRIKSAREAGQGELKPVLSQNKSSTSFWNSFFVDVSKYKATYMLLIIFLTAPEERHYTGAR